jgi:hypothetical protein
MGVLRTGGLHVFGVDAPEFFVVAGTCRLAALGGRAEPLQMDIGDAALVERSGEHLLGESRAPGGCDRAGVDEKLHFGALEFIQHRVGLRLLVADGEERFHLVFSISAMAAAGARTLPS